MYHNVLRVRNFQWISDKENTILPHSEFLPNFSGRTGRNCFFRVEKTVEKNAFFPLWKKLANPAILMQKYSNEGSVNYCTTHRFWQGFVLHLFKIWLTLATYLYILYTKSIQLTGYRIWISCSMSIVKYLQLCPFTEFSQKREKIHLYTLSFSW